MFSFVSAIALVSAALTVAPAEGSCVCGNATAIFCDKFADGLELTALGCAEKAVAIWWDSGTCPDFRKVQKELLMFFFKKKKGKSLTRF